VVVFHVELRQFPHVARAFNQTEAELMRGVLAPWVRGDLVDFGERKWSPERAKLTIYEGPELRSDEIAMGRGWSNATRQGEDATARLLRAAHPKPIDATGAAAEASGVQPLVADFKRELLAQCTGGRIGVHQVLWLANAQYPDWRVSDRLALAERSIWELLHQGRLTMLRASAGGERAGGSEPVGREEWQPVLLAWATWADPRAPSVLLEAVVESASG
jgi:hypothetical protein